MVGTGGPLRPFVVPGHLEAHCTIGLVKLGHLSLPLVWGLPLLFLIIFIEEASPCRWPISPGLKRTVNVVNFMSVSVVCMRCVIVWEAVWLFGHLSASAIPMQSWYGGIRGRRDGVRIVSVLSSVTAAMRLFARPLCPPTFIARHADPANTAKICRYWMKSCNVGLPTTYQLLERSEPFSVRQKNGVCKTLGGTVLCYGFLNFCFIWDCCFWEFDWTRDKNWPLNERCVIR